MSIPLSNKVVSSGCGGPELTIGERLCLMVLAYKAQDDGTTSFTKAMLVKATSISKQKVYEILSRLSEKGLCTNTSPIAINPDVLGQLHSVLDIGNPRLPEKVTLGDQKVTLGDGNSRLLGNPRLPEKVTLGDQKGNPRSPHIDRHKDTRTAQARAREADLDTFLAAYPAHKRAADPKDALADAYAEAIKEATPAQLLAALEAQKSTRQWTEADGRYVATPLNWLTRRTYRAFLPDAKAAEAAKASKQVDDRLASLRNRADDGALADLAGKEAGAYLYAAKSRSALIVLHLALAGDPLPPQTLRTLANDVADIDLAYADLPATLTFEGDRLAVAPIIREARAILRRPATQKGF